MKLPGADGAIIDPRKLKDYLLSAAHPVGRHKATFFVTLGYSRRAWRTLGSDLASLALANDVRATVATPDGLKFIRRGENSPRFVTAYPA